MTPQVDSFADEVRSGQRFEFGRNWRHFLEVLDEDRIEQACTSLREMLGVASLAGRRFLDVGSGSGLFSLAAMRLGAQVHSFDFDPNSVECAHELKRRYFADDPRWTIERASVLDDEAMAALGSWDIVYSWGVLHHTGEMWHALANAERLVGSEGLLFIAIYNDEGGASRRWKQVKALYNRGGPPRWLVTAAFVPYYAATGMASDLLKLRNPLRRYREYRQARGMSQVHDWLDWLGGYPFEVAKVEEIFAFFHDRGFVLERLKTCVGGSGCNEFVLRRA